MVKLLLMAGLCLSMLWIALLWVTAGMLFLYLLHALPDQFARQWRLGALWPCTVPLAVWRSRPRARG